MKADAIINMTEDALGHQCFIIDAIAGDNDNTSQDVLKNPSRGAQGQVLK